MVNLTNWKFVVNKAGGEAVRLTGEAEGHPTLGDSAIRTSTVVKVEQRTEGLVATTRTESEYLLVGEPVADWDRWCRDENMHWLLHVYEPFVLDGLG